MVNLGENPMPFTSSCGVPDQFPAGLRVLVVDDDPTCLRILEQMLVNCFYEVTKCSRAEDALKLLSDNKDGFDIVLSDVHMPDMDGFKLLERIGLILELPVIMMSVDDSKNVVMKGVTHGACDYLIKPVRIEALKNIWQHVVRKKRHEWEEKDTETSGSLENEERQQKPSENVDYSSSANEGSLKNSKKRKDNDEDETEERDDNSKTKKQRVVWTPDLHQRFVTAVSQLGIDKAVPKKILELMNHPALSRENVASHLQKYRLYLRRQSDQHHNGLGNSFMGPSDAMFGPSTSFNGIDIQALASSGQLPPQSLANIQVAALGRSINKPIGDPRNIFSFESPNIRFVEGQQQHTNSNQVNLLHGIPTNMDSRQLAALNQSSHMVQPQPRSQMLNNVSGHVLNFPSSVGQPVLSQAIPNAVFGRNGIDNVRGPTYTSISRPSTVVDFSRSQHSELPRNNTFPLVSNSGFAALTSKGMLQDGFESEMNGSRGFIPNYDVFNGLNQNRTDKWGPQSVGSTFEAPQHSNIQMSAHLRIPSVNKAAFSVHGGLVNNSNPGQQHASPLADDSLSIEAERLPDMGFQNGLFPDQFGQDDLVSAYLKQNQEGMAAIDNEFGFLTDTTWKDNLPV